MGKSAELITTSALVKEILKEFPQARNSDDYLYCKVCEKKGNIYLNLPFWKVMLNRKMYGIPGFETVRRARQKIQETCPELAGCDAVEGQRMLNEEVFREFARGGV